MSRHDDVEAVLTVHAPEVYRFAVVLAADPDVAKDLAAAALAQSWTPRRGADQGGLEDQLPAAVVARWLRHRTQRPDSPASADPAVAAVAGLPARQRALIVLCTYLGVDPALAGQRVGLPARRARAEVRSALLTVAATMDVPPESVPARVRDALRQVAERVRVPLDLVEAASLRAAQGAKRRWRRRRAIASAAVLLVIVGAVVSVVARRPPPTSVPVAAGLLNWPTRGDLAGDGGFREAALRRWREAGPVHRPHPLFLGRIGAGRVAVLEGLDAAGRARVALLADHGVATAVRLDLDLVSPLTNPRVPVVFVPYDGNLNMPGFGVAPPAALMQALVAPVVTRLQRFALEGDFRDVPIRHGLSATWLALPTPVGGLGPIRAFVGQRLVLGGLVPVRGLLPRRATAQTAG